MDLIRAFPTARTFEIGGLIFARFACPRQEQPIGIWSETDHPIHVLTSKSTWTTSRGTWSAQAGETIFFRKGAYISPPHLDDSVCLLLFFMPDAIVRETVCELAAELRPIDATFDPLEVALRVQHDVALNAFIHAMTDYFSGEKPPPKPLLKLKLKEFITSILVGHDNPALTAYFRSLAASQAPVIEQVMEANQAQPFARAICAAVPPESFRVRKPVFQGDAPGYQIPPRWGPRWGGAADLVQESEMRPRIVLLDLGRFVSSVM